jgi:hypothetical protein
MSGLIGNSIRVAVAMKGLSVSAIAEVTYFDYPKHKGLALDWCRSRATDRGKLATTSIVSKSRAGPEVILPPAAA